MSGPSETRTAVITAAAPQAVDHRRAPLVDGIGRYREHNTVAFCTPGHKGGRAIDPALRALFGEAIFASDIPLGGGVDDTHFHGDSLAAAERLGADLWGADRSYYLVNGSSAGNHAFMLALLRPGDEVIVARDLHKSMLVALIMTGARPVYLAPRLDPVLNVGLGLHPDDVAAALDAHPNVKLVALVSPSYTGVPSDLAAIAAAAHARSVPVYVDEAWGPHFRFSPELPPSAMAAGVDGAVISTHKVLGSLTQAAILHVQGPRIDQARLAAAVSMVVTTSPAATILASIDACRRDMALTGAAQMARTLALARDARSRLNAISGVRVLDPASQGITPFDETKLVVDVVGLGLTGFAAEDVLRSRYAVQPEMSDLVGMIFLITVGDTTDTIDRLVGAFTALAATQAGAPPLDLATLPRSSGAAIAPGVQAMSPRDAYFAPSVAVPLASATGQIAAELVIPYPPGIPVLAPGDIITSAKLDYLAAVAAHGMYLSGPADDTLTTIRVVQDHPGGVALDQLDR